MLLNGLSLESKWQQVSSSLELISLFWPILKLSLLLLLLLQKWTKMNYFINLDSLDISSHRLICIIIIINLVLLRFFHTCVLRWVKLIWIHGFSFTETTIKSQSGGARGVMVIVVGNGHGDTSSNPGQDWLHFHIAYWERYESNYSPSSYG